MESWEWHGVCLSPCLNVSWHGFVFNRKCHVDFVLALDTMKCLCMRMRVACWVPSREWCLCLVFAWWGFSLHEVWEWEPWVMHGMDFLLCLAMSLRDESVVLFCLAYLHVFILAWECMVRGPWVYKRGFVLAWGKCPNRELFCQENGVFAWVGDEWVLACFCMGLSFAWELPSECLCMHEKFAWKMNSRVYGEWVCMVDAVCLRIWWFIVFAWWVVRRWEVSSSILHEKEFLNFFCLSLFRSCLIVVY